MSIIALDVAKSFLRVGFAVDDVLIQLLVDGVEEWVERRCAVSLVAVTPTDYLSGGGYALRPAVHPVNSITRITDVDSGAVLSSALFSLRDSRQVLYSGGETRWPDGRQRYKVEYSGGYMVVPTGLQLALLGLVARAYRNRGGVTSESAAGWSIVWDKLLDSDIGKGLTPYDFSEGRL